jgi:uncharacterized protein (TIGR00645 family)
MLFASRWLLAPLYFGLACLLLLFIWQFFVELAHMAAAIGSGQEAHLTLDALTLLDLVLIASLIVMVMLSGFENFVAKITIGAEQRSLAWLTALDPGSIKVKILTSVAVISAIDLLKIFFEIDDVPNDKLLWNVVIQLTLTVTAIAFAAIGSRGEH